MAFSLALGKRALSWRFGLGAFGRGGFCSSRLELPCEEEEFKIGSYRFSFEANPKNAPFPYTFDDGVLLKMQNMEREDQSVSKVFSTVSASPLLPHTSPCFTVDYRRKQFHCNDHTTGTGISFERSQSARIIRTPIRRLFPANLDYDVKVLATVLFCEEEHDTDVMVANATSAALMLSDIPWGGPIGVVRVAKINGKFVINPSRDELLYCDLDLIYACTRDHKTLIADVQSHAVRENDREEALQLAHRQAVKYIAPQIILAEKAAKYKKDYPLTRPKKSTVPKITSLVGAQSKAFIPDSMNEKVICTETQRRPGEDKGPLRVDGNWKKVDAGNGARISMIKDGGSTMAAKNKTSHTLAKRKVKTVSGNELSVGGLHEDMVTEMKSCVEVNGGYVYASEKPIKQVSGKVNAVQRQEYEQFPHRPSKFSSEKVFLDHDVESDLLEWVQAYCDSPEISDSLA